MLSDRVSAYSFIVEMLVRFRYLRWFRSFGQFQGRAKVYSWLITPQPPSPGLWKTLDSAECR